MSEGLNDRWAAGGAYDAFMGRWSRRLADAFLNWARPAHALSWLELGCGTGALTAAVCERCDPASVVACEPSAAFVEYARLQLPDPRVSFVEAGAEALPRREGGFDMAAAGLVLNFLPDARAAVGAVRERLRPGGTAAAYVWDYSDGMEFLRIFWDEAVALDPRAAALHEGRRFPLCHPQALASLFQSAGFERVETDALEIATDFTAFDDYWLPFLQGTGPAPTYVLSLLPGDRDSLQARLQRRLATRDRGPIRLRARAWAVRGVSS